MNRGVFYRLGRAWGSCNFWQKFAIGLSAVFVVNVFAMIVYMQNRYAALPTTPTQAAYVPPPPEVKPPTKADREVNIVLGGAQFLKERAKKPETFELLNATMIDGKVICYTYRARNSFNDRMTEHYVISETVSSGTSKDWNKHCAGKQGDDYTYVRAVLR